MSLPREDLWSDSCRFRLAIPASVRDISCSTPASWLASVSSCLVCALRFPDSSISSDPCLSSTDGSSEVSTPAVELLADLVELGGELVDLGLDLADGRLRRRVDAGGEDRETADRDQPGRDRDT